MLNESSTCVEEPTVLRQIGWGLAPQGRQDLKTLLRYLSSVRWLALAPLLTVALLLGAHGAEPGQKPAAKPVGLPVKAVAARSGTVTSEITAVGTLLADESVVIRPEVAGRVTALHFSEGQAVAAGARLVTLDAAEVKAQLEASRADERLSEQRSRQNLTNRGSLHNAASPTASTIAIVGTNISHPCNSSVIGSSPIPKRSSMISISQSAR